MVDSVVCALLKSSEPSIRWKRLPEGGWPPEKRYYKVNPSAVEAHADYVDWGRAGSG